ncbi:MAG: hypothetical protein Q9217_004877 [Psora testacea]
MPIPDNRPVFFFDIDNCLYPRSKRVQDLMQELIDAYFVRHLSLPAEEATKLLQKYYKDYGLAISGLVKHHQIDPLAYNREVDDALPLEGVLTEDEGLMRLLEDIDTSKVKLWLFTNAHITHARRVVSLLGVEGFFEGVTYCDYGKMPLIAKPHTEMFDKAEREAGVHGKLRDCFFVDDSALNCRHANERGWTVVHKLEEDDPEPETRAGKYQIRSLEELRKLFPNFFRNKEPIHGEHQKANISSQL